jgi:hypothetical protein
LHETADALHERGYHATARLTRAVAHAAGESQ